MGDGTAEAMQTNGGNSQVGSGGGGTDFSFVNGSMTLSNGRYTRTQESYLGRVIVAGGGGGGGGSGSYSGSKGGFGGGASGGDGNQSSTGGTQSSIGGTGSGSYNTVYAVAGFGYGASGKQVHSSYEAGCGGGGGWYGGSMGSSGNMHTGGGGSGYVLTASSYKPANYALGSEYYLTSAQTIAGNQSFPAPGGGNETGHSGNGYARITLVE